MNINSVDGIETIPVRSEFQLSFGEDSAPNFSTVMLNEIGRVNLGLVGAEQSLQQLAAGETSNIHHVMLTLERANTSFQLLMQIRNKLIDGYQDILKMQI